MKERPILFSGPMVSALLDGRKTQTRRVVKPQPVVTSPEVERDIPAAWAAGFVGVRCPYGVPGERLWVRESGLEHRNARLFIHDATPGRWWTPEDGGRYGASYGPAITRQSLLRNHRVRPSIHMPRWASRITLQITDVRVERLNDCSEDDALAEGVLLEFYDTARDAYADLWEHINGPGSWAANPWVWAVSFEVVR